MLSHNFTDQQCKALARIARLGRKSGMVYQDANDLHLQHSYVSVLIETWERITEYSDVFYGYREPDADTLHHGYDAWAKFDGKLSSAHRMLYHIIEGTERAKNSSDFCLSIDNAYMSAVCSLGRAFKIDSWSVSYGEYAFVFSGNASVKGIKLRINVVVAAMKEGR